MSRVIFQPATLVYWRCTIDTPLRWWPSLGRVKEQCGADGTDRTNGWYGWGTSPPVIRSGYNPYKWPYKLVTRFITPISGILTIVIAGRGTPYRKSRCLFLFSREIRGKPQKRSLQEWRRSWRVFRAFITCQLDPSLPIFQSDVIGLWTSQVMPKRIRNSRWKQKMQT